MIIRSGEFDFSWGLSGGRGVKYITTKTRRTPRSTKRKARRLRDGGGGLFEKIPSKSYRPGIGIGTKVIAAEFMQ